MGLLLHGATRQCERFWGIGSRLNFNFVTVSSAGLVDGVSHELILTGRGTFNSRYVVGGGSWSHSAANTPAPQELISSGIWRATSLTSWTPLNPRTDSRRRSGNGGHPLSQGRSPARCGASCKTYRRLQRAVGGKSNGDTRWNRSRHCGGVSSDVRAPGPVTSRDGCFYSGSGSR